MPTSDETTVSLLISLNIDPDSGQDHLLPAIMEHLEQYKPELLKLMGDFFSKVEMEAFETDGASIGRPWAYYAPSSIQRPKMLYHTGKLEESIAAKRTYGSNFVSIGFDPGVCWYTKIHNEGSPASNLPARVLIGILPSQVDQMIIELKEHLSLELGLDPSQILVESR